MSPGTMQGPAMASFLRSYRDCCSRLRMTQGVGDKDPIDVVLLALPLDLAPVPQEEPPRLQDFTDLAMEGVVEGVVVEEEEEVVVVVVVVVEVG
jgi:hypothetical protein